MEIEASAKASRVIVRPSLVWSGTVDASRSMSEEFNRVYMHLFDDHSHRNNMPVSMHLLLLMTMTVLWMNYYSHKNMNTKKIRVTEGVKKSAVPEEHQNIYLLCLILTCLCLAAAIRVLAQKSQVIRCPKELFTIPICKSQRCLVQLFAKYNP